MDSEFLFIKLTNPCFLWAHIEGCYQVFQEKPNQSEVESSNTPRPVNQDYNISNSWSFTEKFHFCKAQVRKLFVTFLEKVPVWTSFRYFTAKNTMKFLLEQPYFYKLSLKCICTRKKVWFSSRASLLEIVSKRLADSHQPGNVCIFQPVENHPVLVFHLSILSRKGLSNMVWESPQRWKYGQEIRTPKKWWNQTYLKVQVTIVQSLQ